MKDNTLLIKSKAFAIRIVRMYKWLTKEQQEYVLSKQCLATDINRKIIKKHNVQQN